MLRNILNLMSTIYFHVAEHHLTNNYMKENSDKGCVLNVNSAEINELLGQNLSGLKVYSSFVENSESEKIKKIQKN